MAYNVFLSHNEADRYLANWIFQDAQNIGVNVYIYEHDLQPGIQIADKIQQAIENTEALIVLLTRNSQYSPYVQQEIGFAQAKQKLVIPIVEAGVSQRCLAMLEGKEYIKMDSSNPQMALSSLQEYLQRLKESRETDQQFLYGLGALFLIALLSKK
jgi:hypothetical protein